MPSMQEALKNVGLVDPEKAEQIEKKRRAELEEQEKWSAMGARSIGVFDEMNMLDEERFHHQAARESRQPTSNRNSKEYLKRFMKR